MFFVFLSYKNFALCCSFGCHWRAYLHDALAAVGGARCCASCFQQYFSSPLCPRLFDEQLHTLRGLIPFAFSFRIDAACVFYFDVNCSF